MRAFTILCIGFVATAFVACSGAAADSSAGSGSPNDTDGGGTTSDAGKGGPPKASCKVTGFDSNAVDFALPDVGATAGYHPFQLPDDTSQGVSDVDSVSFATLDADGDGRVDLVLTQHAADGAVGQSVWKVYKGGAAGFSATAVDFALPNFGATGSYHPFGAIGGSSQGVSSADSISFNTIDMDGDGLPDLVVTRHVADDAVGRTVWKVYEGSRSGFASSPVDFALPDVGATSGNHPFDQTAGAEQAVRNGDAVSFAAVDVDGDGRRDLVVTRHDADDSVGRTVWRVYKGASSGFVSPAIDFALPDVGATGAYHPFGQVAGTHQGARDGDSVSFAGFDIDGNGLTDFVLSADDADDTLGRSRWKTFRGSGSGFASSAADFALPDIGATGSYRPFGATAGVLQGVSDSDAVTFGTLDADGDGIPDLVVFQHDADDAVGKTVWQVYPGGSSGFAATPVDFALPDFGATGSFHPFGMFSGSHQGVSAADSVSYATLDVDGDAKLDLVVMQHDSDDAVGRTSWKVYRGLCK